jgi:antitoxin CptB
MKPKFDHNLNELQRLAWSCRRGMLELDVILTKFLRERYNCLNIEQKQAFTELLRYSDPDLFSFFLGDSLPGIPLHDDIVLLVRRYARNNLSN